MPADDLSTPLGQNKKKAKRFQLPVNLPTAIAGALGLVLAIFFAWALVMSDPMGGEPSVVVAINPPQEAKPGGEQTAWADQPPRNGAEAGNAPPPGESQTVNIIDGSTGKRQEVQIGGGTGQASRPSGGEYRLLESTRHGMIPKIGSDGARAADIYSRTRPEMTKASAPRIAIVVSGLGVGAKLTADAIAKLPPAVTLAFTPYGPDAGASAAKARETGHEILLQVAMEPFDYPDNDPGPQTLLTTLATDANLDRLYWHLSRFQGYAGIANFMGARFVVTDAVMQPIIREAAKRGLGYLDDGSAPRSTAPALAAAQAMPFAKADFAIDAVPTAAEIDRALARLENLAKERGTAIGVASALPISIERIGVWSKALESRGILLVPLTTAMLKSKSG